MRSLVSKMRGQYDSLEGERAASKAINGYVIPPRRRRSAAATSSSKLHPGSHIQSAKQYRKQSGQRRSSTKLVKALSKSRTSTLRHAHLFRSSDQSRRLSSSSQSSCAAKPQQSPRSRPLDQLRKPCRTVSCAVQPVHSPRARPLASPVHLLRRPSSALTRHRRTLPSECIARPSLTHLHRQPARPDQAR